MGGRRRSDMGVWTASSGPEYPRGSDGRDIDLVSMDSSYHFCLLTPPLRRLRRRLQRLNLNRPSQLATDTPPAGTPSGSVMGDTRLLRDFDDCFETGFQIATFQGPLCSEPMQGMCFFVESIQLGGVGSAADMDAGQCRELVWTRVCTDTEVPRTVHAKTAQITGSLISAVKDACRAGLLDWSPRLMLAMYTCDIQAASTCDPPTPFRYADPWRTRSRCTWQSLRCSGPEKGTNRVRRNERGHQFLHNSGAPPCRGELWFCGRYATSSTCPYSALLTE